MFKYYFLLRCSSSIASDIIWCDESQLVICKVVGFVLLKIIAMDSQHHNALRVWWVMRWLARDDACRHRDKIAGGSSLFCRRPYMRWNEGLEIVDARDINIQPMRVTTGRHGLKSRWLFEFVDTKWSCRVKAVKKDCRLSAVSSTRSARVPLDAASKQTVRKQRPLQDPDFRTHLLPLRNVVWFY